MRDWLQGTLNKTGKCKKLWSMETYMGVLKWFLLSSPARLPNRETEFKE